MPLRFDQFQQREFQDCTSVGLNEREVVNLMQEFHLFGFWRIDLDTGLFYATPDVFRIYGLKTTDGKMSLAEFGARVHPDDLPMVMESFERTCQHKQSYHNIYQALGENDHYKYVRTVGRFREKPGTSGEIIGITYEFFERLRTVAFSDAPRPD